MEILAFYPLAEATNGELCSPNVMAFNVEPLQFLLLALQRGQAGVHHDQIHLIVCRLQRPAHQGVLAQLHDELHALQRLKEAREAPLRLSQGRHRPRTRRLHACNQSNVPIVDVRPVFSVPLAERAMSDGSGKLTDGIRQLGMSLVAVFRFGSCQLERLVTWTGRTTLREFRRNQSKKQAARKMMFQVMLAIIVLSICTVSVDRLITCVRDATDDHRAQNGYRVRLSEEILCAGLEYYRHVHLNAGVWVVRILWQMPMVTLDKGLRDLCPWQRKRSAQHTKSY